jgi:hypothetical protein
MRSDGGSGHEPFAGDLVLRLAGRLNGERSLNELTSLKWILDPPGPPAVPVDVVVFAPTSGAANARTVRPDH